MYCLSLIIATNAADNKRKLNKKYIDIEINGIDNQIDKIINDFIQGINNVLYDDILTLRYSLKNALFIFKKLENLLKEKCSEF